jgi:competence protein ComEC
MFEKFLHQTPFFRIVIPFIIGILFQINFPILSGVIIFIIAILLLTITIFSVFKLTRNYSLNKLWGVLLSLMLLFSGMQLVNFKVHNKFDFNKNEQTFVATIIEQPKETEKSVKTILSVSTLKDSLSWQKRNAQVVCYFQKDSNTLQLNFGDQIIATAFVNEIKNSGNPFEFDYKKYLKYKGIYYQTYIKSSNYSVLAHEKCNILWQYSHKARQSLLNIYKEQNISGDEFAVLSALTLGFKNDLTPELKESFSASGAMHILAVSGLHVGIIFIVLCKMLFFLQRNKYGRIIQSVIIIILLFSYAFITGFSDSVFRATTMFSFISIGRMFKRQINIYNTISASAFLLLIINPYSIMNVGFQLSYAAVISIVFFQAKIYSLLSFKNIIPDYIWQLISVAIAAQIGTFPITIHYFNQFPLYFILSNIIIIPIAILIIYGAILLFAFSFSDFISKYISYGLEFITRILNRNVSFIEELPFSKLENILFDRIEVLILLVLIFTGSFFIIKKKFYYLKASVLILICVLCYNIINNYKISGNSIFVVHNIKGVSAINLIEGKKSSFICNKIVNYSSNTIDYSVNPIWKKQRTSKVVTIKEDSLKTFNSFSFRDIKILHLKNNQILNWQGSEKIASNYIILSENIDISISEITSYFEFDKIIFDSSNSFYKIKTWKNDCLSSGIKFHDVSEGGAYIRYL